MTRRVVYGIGIWCTLAAAAMTLASIALPRWVRWESDIGGDIKFTYGLHRKCSSVTGVCDPFPTPRDCERDGATFCALWRSVGFLASLAVLLEAACLVSIVVALTGGVRSRAYGWKVVCALMGLAALAQMAGMAIAYEFDHDERFFPGWKLDVSWMLCTVSWCVLALSGLGIGVSACVLPSEGGYELIPESE